MDTLLAKILATALTFSQVTIDPDHLQTQFDAEADTGKVVAILQAGCAHMRKAFDVEAINLDDLIAVAMDDPDAAAGGKASFKGIEIKDLYVAYRQFCKNDPNTGSTIDLRSVIEFYNRTMADLPDAGPLKTMKLGGTSMVLDQKDQPISEVQEQHKRRIWVPLADVPQHVQQAFIAAEDKNFFEHKGVDERGIVRAFISNLGRSGRPQGGSTLTQQVVKNLLVGDAVTYERKMREVVVASRVEATLTKDEILELYLNSIYLGRASWGVGMAARSYFGKSIKELTIGEGALLAALTKGPS